MFILFDDEYFNTDLIISIHKVFSEGHKKWMIVLSMIEEQTYHERYDNEKDANIRLQNIMHDLNGTIDPTYGSDF
jgi:hypothetical protein